MAASKFMKDERLDEPHPKRRVGRTLEDRISSLPDDLRSDIVCRLPTTHAFRTCMLSRSWRKIFSSLQSLVFVEFDFPDVRNRAQRFSSFIDWVLANHDQSNVYTLIIEFDIFKNPPVMDNAWVTFALEHNVHILDLMGRINDTEGLPSDLFLCRSMFIFRLVGLGQILKLPDSIDLPNLMRLVLVNIKLPDDTLMDKLFSGCPRLGSLSISSCGMPHSKRLAIHCPKLQLLYISQCKGIEDCDVHFQIPCIKSLHYEGAMARKFEFGSMNCISDAYFNLERDLENGRNDSELAPIVLSLFSAVHNASDLTMNSTFNEILPIVQSELGWLSCFSNLTSVRLCLWDTEDNKEMFLTLLGKFRCVQRLGICFYRSQSSNDMPGLLYWYPNVSLEGIFTHLQYLHMDNFEACCFQIGLLLLFLRNAQYLTTVKITIPAILSEDEVDSDRPPGYDKTKLLIIDQLDRLMGMFPQVNISVSAP